MGRKPKPKIEDTLSDLVKAQDRFNQKYMEAFHELQARITNILSTKYEHSEKVNNDSPKS
jgi:hypothetical protein